MRATYPTVLWSPLQEPNRSGNLRPHEHARVGYVIGFADGVTGRQFNDNVRTKWGNAQWHELKTLAQSDPNVARQMHGADWKTFGSGK